MRAHTLLFFAFASQSFSFGSAHTRLNRRYSHSPAVSRTIPDADVELIASRQHHERRNLLDVCAYIDTPDILSGDILGIPLSDILDLDLCLCLSAFPLVLYTDLKLKLLTDEFGVPLVDAALQLLINGSPSKQSCTYPDHSQQVCNADDPCGFTCESPYVKEGNQCVCPVPYSVCNGVCGDYSSGCGSGVPRSLQARADGRNYNHLTGLASAQASCKAYETVCGVYNGAGSAYECIDTARNLESCGGCVVPNPFLQNDASSPFGRDCTAIEGANVVSCISGACAVTSCNEGWELNNRGDGCVEVQGRTAASALGMVAQAMAYSGLTGRAPQSNPRPYPAAERREHGEAEHKVEKPEAEYYNNAWFAH
ncbi:hypothetical protein NM688_g6080 [Phlebia brevispora]|uniref:Uncharacterized protein n=1 Tax=Phlebia brevispora TaxID=194682 RepID=A0ACC1SK27_9APHY|nr:hypothetical protein NM688_g6080 [Phlebia brevispora]